MSAYADDALRTYSEIPDWAEIWRATNFADRLYFVYAVALTVLISIFHDRLPHWPEYLLLHALGIGVIVLLALGARRSQAVAFLHDWYPVVAFIVCFEEVARLSLLVVPQWRDPYILNLEARLFRVPPTEWLRRFSSPLLTEILEIGYFSYFLYILIVGGALYPRDDKWPFRQVMSANVLAYGLCYIWFILFPTQGPAHTLPGVPNAELQGGPFHWAVLLIQRLGGVQGNAFPSSHVAAALTSVFFAWRYLPRLGASLTPFFVLLCAGVVYDRYHYFSDVVGGLVFGAVAIILTLAWQRMGGRLD